MNINMLKYFAAVAKTQQITMAAKQLNITQPALSTAIKRLEDEIGFQLFDRVGASIKLNSYGKVFLKTVAIIEDTMNEGLAEMELIRQQTVRYIRLGCSSSRTNSQLISHLFSNGIKLQVDTVPHDWEDELLRNNIDLVIALRNSQHPDIGSTVLYYRKFNFIASKDHPLATAKFLTTDDLKHYAFCALNDPRSVLDVANDIFKRVDFSPRITFLGRSYSDLLNAIRSGKCIGLIAISNLTPEDSEDLVVLPVQNVHISLPYHLYWRKGESRDFALNYARQFIIDFYQDIPKEL